MSRHPDPGVLARDDLPAVERRKLVEHLGGCARCRRDLVETDPSRAFVLLALAPLPVEALDRLSDGLARRIDDLDRRRRPRTRVSVASLAASLLLAGFLGGYLLRQEAPAPVAVLAHGTDVAGSGAAAVPPAAGVELISSPGDAQVMELAIGDTQVVMIFDEALDI